MLVKFVFESLTKKSPASAGLFVSAVRSAAKPGIYSGGAILFFPGFEAAVVAAFSLDQLAGVRVMVHLDHACAALFRGGGRCSTGLGRVRVKDRDDVAQAFAVVLHQALQLFFEFDFFLQAGVVLQ